MTVPKLLENKTALVLGVANKRSIAWAIANRFHEAGARLAITYQDERLRDKVEPLVEGISDCLLIQCDLTKPEEIEETFAKIDSEFDGLDILVHSVAFALKDELEGRFSDTSPEGFQVAHNVSSYTLTSTARAARPLMEKKGGGSILAMTYYGSTRVIPHYNVMGVAKASLEASIRYLASDFGEFNIRVNGLSPGPLNTLAARGITGFPKMLKYVAEHSPLRKNTELDEVADTAMFIASDLARGITGEIIHIDGGYHIVGM
ncbi:MAG: enoyl-ACP reductase [Candidatus Omnitrophica bacterium]|nr:enoyl-ACP reductase [Candidatus Omnitrophota bacterium]